jgi:hypothetical protein
MSARDVQRVLRFFPLAFLDEGGDEVVVGRTDIDSYGVFPSQGAALLREMCAGRDPADAAAWFQATYDDEVDMIAFLATLRELRFVTDERDAGEPPPSAGLESEALRFRRLGRALFAWPAWAFYAVLVGTAVIAVVKTPGLLPAPGHVLFSDLRIVVLATIVLGQVPLVMLHEAFHVLAARRLGVRSSIRVSHRLYFVVFETVLDGLAVVPSRKRYLPILAGMVADVLAVAALILAAAALPAPLHGACLALAFATLLRLAWQFCFFMRTDVYYLITTVTGCVDLHAAARQLLANHMNALLGRRDRIVDPAAWHARDRRAARWYAPLLVMGYAAAVGVLAVVVAPLAWAVLGGALEAVFLDDRPPSRQYWDSLAVLAVNGVQLIAAGVLAGRERVDRRR